MNVRNVENSKLIGHRMTIDVSKFIRTTVESRTVFDFGSLCGKVCE